MKTVSTTPNYDIAKAMFLFPWWLFISVVFHFFCLFAWLFNPSGKDKQQEDLLSHPIVIKIMSELIGAKRLVDWYVHLLIVINWSMIFFLMGICVLNFLK